VNIEPSQSVTRPVKNWPIRIWDLSYQDGTAATPSSSRLLKRVQPNAVLRVRAVRKI
jgi:hypothetical protein